VRAEELQSLIIFLLLNVVTQYKLPVSGKLGIVQKIRDATTRNRENLITSHYLNSLLATQAYRPWLEMSSIVVFLFSTSL